MNKSRVMVVVSTAFAIGAGIFLSVKREPEKYSNKWFQTLSREELDIEREKIQKQWCSAGGDYSLTTRLQNLLYRFNDEIRLRDHSNQKAENYEYPPHREHGWNLYKSD